MERKERIRILSQEMNECAVLLCKSETMRREFLANKVIALKEQIAEAELMEKVAGGMPEKRDWTKEKDLTGGECRLFNEAIDLCTAHLAGKLAGLEQIIKNSKLATQVSPFEKWLELCNDLNQALTTHLTK